MVDRHINVAWNAAYWLLRSEARRQLNSQFPDCNWNLVENSDECVSAVIEAQVRICDEAMQGPKSSFGRFTTYLLPSTDLDQFEMDRSFMDQAVQIALDNVKTHRGGPFAALVVKDGGIVGAGSNSVTALNDPTAHAEINAIRAACAALEAHQLDECDIYTTCEPCPMCMGAIYWARPKRVIYAATREDAAAAGFDDDFIYRELALPPDRRKIRMVRAPHPEAVQALEAWSAQEDRVDY